MKSLLVLIFSVSVTLADNSAIQEFTNANNQFTSSVYKELLKSEKGNFLVSPFSAETVLALAYFGCKGDSAQELHNALHLPNDKDQIRSEIKTFLPGLIGNEYYTLHTVNKIYIKKDFEIKEEFKNVVSEVFNAESENIDFTKKFEAAETINNWLEKQTKDKIRNLINSEDLNEDTRTVLINALYFKANWSTPFYPPLTDKDKFYKTETDFVEVDFMKISEQYFNYYESPDLEAKYLELPFQGDVASMIIVLPNENDGLSRLENQLESVFVPQDKLQSTYLNVNLPKFYIESSIDFKDVLLKLGVEKFFDDSEADLSEIAGEKSDLKIDKIAQKTFINVTEEGVEAAAATAGISAAAKSLITANPIEFSANHPFIFYIKLRNLIIFTGRVTDPSA